MLLSSRRRSQQPPRHGSRLRLVAPQDSAACASLGQAIQRLRRREGLSRRELARDAKVDYGALRRIERGEACPSCEELLAISNTLVLPLSSLIGHFENEHYVFEDKQPACH